MKAVGFELEHLHGIGDLKMFMNGKMAPKVITTTNVWTTTKFVYKCGFKSYEKSWTHNCQEVFIYNTLFWIQTTWLPYKFCLVYPIFLKVFIYRPSVQFVASTQ